MATSRVLSIPVLALALLATPALACDGTDPPARYRDMPRPEYSLRPVASLYGLHGICGEITNFGCADVANMVVIYLSEIRDDMHTWRCFVRHEEAHLNGWPADHPR